MQRARWKYRIGIVRTPRFDILKEFFTSHYCTRVNFPFMILCFPVWRRLLSYVNACQLVSWIFIDRLWRLVIFILICFACWFPQTAPGVGAEVLQQPQAHLVMRKIDFKMGLDWTNLLSFYPTCNKILVATTLCIYWRQPVSELLGR